MPLEGTPRTEVALIDTRRRTAPQGARHEQARFTLGAPHTIRSGPAPTSTSHSVRRSHSGAG